MASAPDPDGCPRCGRVECPLWQLHHLPREEKRRRISEVPDADRNCTDHAIDWRALYFASVASVEHEKATTVRCDGCLAAVGEPCVKGGEAPGAWFEPREPHPERIAAARASVTK